MRCGPKVGEMELGGVGSMAERWFPADVSWVFGISTEAERLERRETGLEGAVAMLEVGRVVVSIFKVRVRVSECDRRCESCGAS